MGGFMLLRFIVATFSAGITMLAAGIVAGQDFPQKPVRIVASEPGGAGDFAARLIAQGIAGGLGQQIIVENRAGAGGAIAADLVAKAPADGYTLLFYANNIWLLPFMQTVPYDPVRDFSPITLAVKAPNLLVVHPSLPVKSVKELIALAKARPGALNYATGGTGSSNHLGAELFKALAGVNIVRITYKGAAPALNEVISGQVQVMFPTTAAGAPHVKAGRLTALAVTTAQPSALAPGLPTVAAAGLPGYESAAMFGMFAPTGTRDTIIQRLSQEIVRVLTREDVKEKFFNAGVETVASSPEQLAAIVKSDMARMGKVIKDAGIRGE